MRCVRDLKRRSIQTGNLTERSTTGPSDDTNVSRYTDSWGIGSVLIYHSNYDIPIHSGWKKSIQLVSFIE